MHIIGGEFRRRAIATPKGSATRPTSARLREAVFNICRPDILDARFLDICAGSGAMGLEALSQGAAYALFIENNHLAIQAILQNIKSFAVSERTKLISKDAHVALKQILRDNLTFTLCYIDPPYHQKELLLDIITFLDQNRSLIAPGGTIFVEDAADSFVDGLVLNQLSLESRRKIGDTTLYVFKN